MVVAEVIAWAGKPWQDWGSAVAVGDDSGSVAAGPCYMICDPSALGAADSDGSSERQLQP